MKLNIASFKAVIFLALFSCDPSHKGLTIVNKSNDSVYLFYSCDSTLNNLKIFRPGYTKLPNRVDSSYITSSSYIKHHTLARIPSRGINPTFYNINNCQSDELYFYFFIDSIVNSFSDNEIKNKKMYKWHMKYCKKELEENNWTIKLQ